MNEILMRVYANEGLEVVKMNFHTKGLRGLMHANVIGISETLSEDEELETLAHELAHHYLHYDKGNTIESPLHDAYEEQAERASKMVLDILKVIV